MNQAAHGFLFPYSEQSIVNFLQNEQRPFTFYYNSILLDYKSLLLDWKSLLLEGVIMNVWKVGFCRVEREMEWIHRAGYRQSYRSVSSRFRDIDE